MSRPMTDVEMKHFLRQVERRGKALALPDAERAKWQGEYDKITLYLRENYKNFVCSKIVRHKRYLDLDVFAAFAESEKNGMLVEANQLVNAGNAEDLDWICWLMHLKYMLMWREAQEVF